MDRYAELEKAVKNYRAERIKAKEEYLHNHYRRLFPLLFTTLDILIQEQVTLQEENKQEKIKNVSFHRLLSSGYTQSYEIAVGLSNENLYFDEHMSYAYWKPEWVYENIDCDMEGIRKCLSVKFVRLEDAELLHIKQKILLDDWKLFCGILDKMAAEIAEKLISSPLLLDTELQILYGNYMDRLSVAGQFRTERVGSNG